MTHISNTNSSRVSLRSLLAQNSPILTPSVWDPLTACLIERKGFPALSVGGWVTGASLAITEPLLTMTEQVRVAGAVARAVKIPVIADGHTGYGDFIHTMRAIREYEDAGIAAIHIEDQLFPKRAHYHKDVKHVIPMDEMIQKIHYAIKARRNPEFIIIARTDARGAVGGTLDETIRRLNAYKSAGADVLLPLVYDFEEGKILREAIPDIPLIWASGELGGVEEPSADELFNAGFQIIIYPLSMLLTAASAVIEMAETIKRTGRAIMPDFRPIQTEVEEAIGLPALYEVEEMTTEKAEDASG